MTIISISAGRGSIVVVYAEGDATAADAFATALAQHRRVTQVYPVGDRG